MIVKKNKVKKTISNIAYLMSTGKPIVFFRYLKKYAEAILLKRVSPRQIDIALTFDCNLHCDHCFTAPMYNKGEKELSYNVLRKVAKECLELGITVIHFTGGEVLLRDDLENVIKLFNPRKNIIYIQSNGTLGTYERFISLKKAGLDFFGASLEYPDKEKQDKFRHHAGYFDKTLETLTLAQKAGLQTSVNITIDNELIHSPALSELIEMLGNKGHIVYGNLPVPVGRFKDKQEFLWFDNERTLLKKLTEKYPFFRTEFDSNFGDYGCPAMKEKIYLCAYGDVLACPYIHLSFGNVNHVSLTDIYNKAMTYDTIRHYHDHCLAAENKTFIETIINKTDRFDRQPVECEHFDEELKNIKSKENTDDIYLHDLTLTGKKCPLCNSSHSKNVVSARDYETRYTNIFSVVQCLQCDLVYTSPSPSDKDLFAYFYDDNYLCYTSSGTADKIRESYLCRSRYNEFKKILPDGGNFLDVGCAHGYFLEFLQNNTDWKAFGCEPNTKMAADAGERGLNVKAATLTDAGYKDDFFDMIYMSHVLEHVPDPVETLNEVYRILKPGGIFLTENPDFNSPTREFFGPCWWGYHLPRHLIHFTGKTITGMLNNSGFEVKKIKPCFRPGPLAWSIQNVLKQKNAPPILSSVFGLQNPIFVTAMVLPTLYHLSSGNTEMMETLAVKPL